MRNLSRFKPSPALVISLIALSVSISGVAWAAATIGTNDIKNGAVTKKKLHKNAVSTNKVNNNAINTAKIADSAVNGAKIANDAVNGSKIADNAVNSSKVANGSIGAADLGTVTVRTADISVPGTSARIVSRSCDPGELALSVGANWNGAPTVGVLQAATFLTGSPEPNGGSAAGRNEGGGARTLTVSVACLAP
jgi:hypothetical protein